MSVAATEAAITPPPITSQMPAQQRLGRNPQLPEHPLGAYTDAQYEAQVAALRYEIQKRYAEILAQLGSVNPDTGEFAMGSVETDAAKQTGELQRSQRLAAEEVTNQSQREGTLFSGIRGTNQARAEHPFVQGQADIQAQLPRILGGLFDQAGGLMDEYTLRNNQMLADAASRQAGNIIANPSQVPGPVGGTTPAGEVLADPSTWGIQPGMVDPVGGPGPIGGPGQILPNPSTSATVQPPTALGGVANPTETQFTGIGPAAQRAYRRQWGMM